MPYRFPSVIFSDWARIFFVCLLASHNPKTTMKNVCMYVCPIFSICRFWSIYSSISFKHHIWLIWMILHGRFWSDFCFGTPPSPPKNVPFFWAGSEVFLVVWLPFNVTYGLFGWICMGVFHPILVLTPPSPPKNGHFFCAGSEVFLVVRLPFNVAYGLFG